MTDTVVQTPLDIRNSEVVLNPNPQNLHPCNQGMHNQHIPPVDGDSGDMDLNPGPVAKETWMLSSEPLMNMWRGNFPGGYTSLQHFFLMLRIKRVSFTRPGKNLPCTKRAYQIQKLVGCELLGGFFPLC